MGVATVADLHRRAVDDPPAYYDALVAHLGIVFSQPYTGLVDLSRGREFPSWFPGGRLNLVDTCLRPRPGAEGALSVIASGEAGPQVAVSFAELRSQIQQLANYLTARGVQPGDCIGLHLPMTVEATVAFFACAWLGAVAVPAFSGYGPDALAARLRDCRAKILITATGFQRRGAWVDMGRTAQAAIVQSADVQEIICVGDLPAAADPAIWNHWTECLAFGAAASDTPPESLDPNHPLLLIYTSGTSGRPKGIVHSHGGFLIKVASDYAIAFDIQEGVRVCWATDLGWLVGPQMMVGNAALGATAVYYTGALDTPDWRQLWRICERDQVDVVGLSPTAVRGMAAAHPAGLDGQFDLRRLKTFASTGEAWDEASWRWLFDKVGGGERPIVNYSGGTEIAGGILASYAVLPMRECAFLGPVIGMDADIVLPEDANEAGGVGELVVRNIWPGMTHSFWGGADQAYLDAYWNTYPGVWRHGDLAERDAEGWWFLRGRSDDTLKVAGRRVGPAEIESALLHANSIIEAAVVGVPDAMKGQSIVAFVVASDEARVSERELQDEVRRRLGASLTPSRIHIVEALPKTRNGKVVRRAILARYLGRDTGDLSALDSMDALLGIPQAEA